MIPQRFYTIKEVAQVLRINEDTVYLMLDAGEIPSIRLRSRRLVPIKPFDAWLDQQDQNAIGAAEAAKGPRAR